MWVVVTWGRKSYLGPAEISCCMLLFKFKDGGHRMSLRFHLFVSDVNRRNEDFGCNEVDARFSDVVTGMERFSLYLL